MSTRDNPFHSGELAAQHRAGVGEVAAKIAPFIRDFMPDQHRQFYQDQPFLVVSSSDADGRVWTTLIEGADGFIQSPDPRRLILDTKIDPTDPLAQTFDEDADIGVIGIELATRRRNRLSGRARRTESGISIDIRQSFGNCPQYISERDWWRVSHAPTSQPVVSDRLSTEQIARISAADTLFIGSGRHGAKGAASNGYDASHRGGEVGFVRVMSPSRLRIPDYSGNNFFNTIGNIIEDPRIGLLFIDFATGGLLHLTGRAKIDWTPPEARDPNIFRVIDVEIGAVVERNEAISLRWSTDPTPSTRLVVAKKVVEAEGITSFLLAPSQGNALASFKAGQHLPIALDIPAQATKVMRTYSLSGKSGAEHYRITVKREARGLASRYLHDQIKVGDVIEAKPPAGDFVIPAGDEPLVLVSAGVGLTPMLAMLHQIADHDPDRPVWFVHGTRNGRHRALSDEVSGLIAASSNVMKRVFFSRPDVSDNAGQDFDVEGRISAEYLLGLNAGVRAHYLLCGPSGFLTELATGLETAGISRGRIAFETFGATA